MSEMLPPGAEHGEREESYEDRLARQRDALASAQADEQARRRRSATLIAVLGTLTAVLAVALVVSLVTRGNPTSDAASPGSAAPSAAASTAGQVVPPANATADRTAVRFGRADAGVTVEVWEDYRCPYCKLFSQALEPVYDELLAAGTIQLHVHPVVIIDGMTGGTGSLDSANAFACADDAGKAREYAAALFANQPAESPEGFPRSELLRIAGTVPGLAGDGFTACVQQGRHTSWVASVQKAFEAKGLTGTPTFFVNGQLFEPAAGIPGSATSEQALAAVRQNLRTAVAAAS